MVKIFCLQFFVGTILAILTYLHFTPKNYFNQCSLKIVTYSSFFEGAGKHLFKRYEDQYLCKLDVHVLKTAGMLGQIKNLEKDYDIILGIDQYQLQDLDRTAFEISKEDFLPLKFGIEKFKDFYSSPGFKLDSAPLTYFIKQKFRISDLSTQGSEEALYQGDGETLGFYSFEDFQIFLERKKIKIAIPSPNSSVLGSLYLNWIWDFADKPSDFLRHPTWIYVSSWTEAFGLFEKSLVGGFLSYETSHIHFRKQNQTVLQKNKNLSKPKDTVDKVYKVEIQSGHPDYTEYFLISNQSKADKDDKYRFVRFIYEDQSQMTLLDKNFMWPAIPIKAYGDSDAKSIKIKPLKTILSKKEILKIWKEVK